MNNLYYSWGRGFIVCSKQQGGRGERCEKQFWQIEGASAEAKAFTSNFATPDCPLKLDWLAMNTVPAGWAPVIVPPFRGMVLRCWERR